MQTKKVKLKKTILPEGDTVLPNKGGAWHFQSHIRIGMVGCRRDGMRQLPL